LPCRRCDNERKQKDSPLDSFVGISKFYEEKHRMDKGRLLSISHVHLLGMGMMFLLVGAAVASNALAEVDSLAR